VRRYSETFARHRLALILPVVIAVVISSAFAISRPHKYESSMSLWFDSPVSQPSSLLNTGNGPTPASGGLAELQEFLATDAFRSDVGLASPLAADLSKPGSRPNLYAIDGVLAKAFTETVAGPQIVQVTMTAANPSYVVGTLDAVANQYQSWNSNALNDRGHASATYYQPEVERDLTALNKANTAVKAYVLSNPKVNLTTDPTYSQLTQTAASAEANYTSDSNALAQAELADQPDLISTSFHVVDPPSPPVALSSKKHDILIGVAGLLAGVIISLLALSALTALDKTARSEEDIDSMLGVDVVASIRELRHRRTLGARGERSS
jgi:uncharacterized protein involved in exopolysaccharide biosynthesis